MDLEKIFNGKKGLDQHTQNAIGLGTFFRRDALSHFFLEHPHHGFELLFPIHHPEQDLGRDIIGEIADHGKLAGKRRVDIQDAGVDDLPFQRRPGFLQVSYLLVIQLYRPEFNTRQLQQQTGERSPAGAYFEQLGEGPLGHSRHDLPGDILVAQEVLTEGFLQGIHGVQNYGATPGCAINRIFKPQNRAPSGFEIKSHTRMSQPQQQKPVIGVSVGDINGIGTELILKTFSDHRLLEFCTPLIFASNKLINFYRKFSPESNFNYQNTKDFTRIAPKQINIFNCWEEEISVVPGTLTDVGGSYAVKSLTMAVEALRDKKIQGLVTAPIHKKNTQSPAFNFTGHTPYLKHAFNVGDVLMMMVSDNFRVGLVTEHVPVKDIAQYITREAILSKLNIFRDSLIRDFGIDKPKIAVLGLNPHAGDEGLIGREEEEIIKPAIKDAKHNMLVFGPYSADAFFARNYQSRFDGVLAMYHDQGLIPFKSLASGEGVNFTAGLPMVRTSPDHGTAFDIAGKNKADHTSFIAAIYTAIDIIRNRQEYDENRSNPLKKMGAVVLANAVDEKIDEQGRSTRRDLTF